METRQFLDYLRDHTATRNLAEEIAYALALRGRHHVAVATAAVRTDRRRLAS